ncbi:phage tail protein [Frigidibacter sp. MR17.14]|uniref:phage tail protein n=1 Tax=Frigidibacter sp. MR17.14 TaxID=3126509 RepID=UPI003012C191
MSAWTSHYRRTTMLSPCRPPQPVFDPISGAIVTALGVSSTGFAAALISAGVSLAVGAVTSWALSALTPKPKVAGLGSAGSQGLLVNERAADAPHDYVYGRVRKGGTVTFMAVNGDDNRYLHQVICLAGHEIDAVEQIYIDDEPVALTDGSAWQYRYDIYRQKTTTSGRGEDATVTREVVFVESRKSRITTAYLAVGTDVTAKSNPMTATGDRAFTGLPGGGFLGLGDGSFARVTQRIPADGMAGGKWKHRIRITKNLGSPTQAADPVLISSVAGLDANFRGRGIAYLYARFEYDPDVFPNGLPLITARIRGAKVHDPNAGLTRWSANAALAIRDYLTSDRGLGDPSVNDASFGVAALVSTEDVSLASGGAEDRYQCNGVISADATIGDVLQRMVTSCAGTLFYGGGEWQLRPAYYSPPVLDLGLDDLRSWISLQTRASMADAVNVVQGTFNDAAQGYVTADYPAIRSARFTAEDGGVEAPLNLDLPFTTSAAAAQRLAKITLYRAREQMTVSADFGLRALECQVGDTVSLTVARYGWAAKEFEVQAWRFFVNGDAGDLRVALTLREISEEVFLWNADEREIVSNNTTLSFGAPEAPGVQLDSELRIVAEQVTSVLIVDLSNTGDQALTYEVQHRPAATEEYIAAGTSVARRFEIPLAGDGAYDVRAKARNALGLASDWTEILDWTSTAFSEPPADVTNFAANVVGGMLQLSWSAVPDLDLSHYKIRFSPLIVGASYQDAVDLVPKIARPATSVSVPAATGTYWVKAVDKGGRVSEQAAARAVVVDLAAVSALNVVETIEEGPSFTGTAEGVVASSDGVGSYLQLATQGMVDDMDELVDDLQGLWDFGGGLQGAGTYEFAGMIDLGEVFTSRVSATAEVQYLNISGGTIDEMIGLWDDLPAPIDGDPTAFDSTSVRLQVDYTQDDPGGAASWAGWQDFVAADLTARAFRFRAILTSRDASATPIIRALSARVDMPDRVEAGEDVAVTGTATILFSAAFRAAPAVAINAVTAPGDVARVTARTAEGFTVTVRTAAGAVSSSPATIDFIAKGYGRVS